MLNHTIINSKVIFMQAKFNMMESKILYTNYKGV